MFVIGFLTVLGLAISNAFEASCNAEYQRYGLSENFNETIAHAIHSLNTVGLKLFNPFATNNNNIPTVNLNLNDDKNRVLNNAPQEEFGSDFATFSMNVIDKVLSNVGKSDDGLGPNWSALERIVHKMHMFDVWYAVKNKFDSIPNKHLISNHFCNCLLDVSNNGIYNAVDWVAAHYKSGTPITLLNRPIPKLTNADSWSIWRSRLLHYYTDKGLNDSALYLYCATKDFKM